MERGVAGPRKKKKDDEDVNKVAMPHHSFATPLVFGEMLEQWAVSGASLIEMDRLLLHPSVSERAGFLWSKAPLLTNDFEVTMHFRVTGPKDIKEVVTDQSFALWYIYENVSSTYNETKMIKATNWLAGLTEQGMTLSGSESKFKGAGAIFSVVDSKTNPKAVVSGIWNDGERDLSFGPGKDVPTADGKAVDYRNTMNLAQFRLRVTPNTITGHLKQSASLSWNECFKLDKLKVESGGYIGLSAWSGTSASPLVSDTVQVEKFEMANFDTTNIIGEEMDVSKQIQEAYREMLTDEKRHFANQKAQTEHLERLEKMLQDHLDTTKPEDAKMYQDLEALQERMKTLDEKGKLLTKEIQVVVGADASPTAMKDEIIGLRRLFTKGVASQRVKLETVKKSIKEVKERKESDSRAGILFKDVVAQSTNMESSLRSRGSQTVWLLLGLMVLASVFCYYMYHRMQYYERKSSGLIF